MSVSSTDSEYDAQDGYFVQPPLAESSSVRHPALAQAEAESRLQASAPVRHPAASESESSLQERLQAAEQRARAAEERALAAEAREAETRATHLSRATELEGRVSELQQKLEAAEAQRRQASARLMEQARERQVAVLQALLGASTPQEVQDPALLAHLCLQRWPHGEVVRNVLDMHRRGHITHEALVTVLQELRGRGLAIEGDKEVLKTAATYGMPGLVDVVHSLAADLNSSASCEAFKGALKLGHLNVARRMLRYGFNASADSERATEVLATAATSVRVCPEAVQFAMGEAGINAAMHGGKALNFALHQLTLLPAFIQRYEAAVLELLEAGAAECGGSEEIRATVFAKACRVGCMSAALRLLSAGFGARLTPYFKEMCVEDAREAGHKMVVEWLEREWGVSEGLAGAIVVV
ncbi:hypothetical protein Agub_g12458 [Astrephomene gubernaculifera]|uniref:Uncharacterized protein n=1 Tax=Astrephomene gubernaculifera TaxID=47775 RepID=A0AAD3HRI4_9CHLO|nr:hypothetical protein Agub_g12458 [Astrephomene gubernaculifera]